jgi:hypothetical protein
MVRTSDRTRDRVPKDDESTNGLPHGVIVFTAIVALIIVFAILASRKSDKERVDRENQHISRANGIYEKYGRGEIAERILRGEVWIGQTSAQLIDSIGRPVDVDQKVLKTKKKEVWKYAQKSARSFGLKITLDDDIVVGWDEKL